MFGLSLSKIVFTVIVMVVVWGAFKYYGRLLGGRRENGGTVRGDRPSLRDRVEKAAQDAVRKRMGEDPSTPAQAPTEDLVRCPACGTWHPRGTPCCGGGNAG